MKRKSGFTLVELILTITILIAVVMSFYLMFTQGFGTVAKGGDKTISAFQSQQIAENIYANTLIVEPSPTPTPYPTDIVNTTTNYAVTVNLTSPSSISITGTKYSIQVNEKSLPIDLFIPITN